MMRLSSGSGKSGITSCCRSISSPQRASTGGVGINLAANLVNQGFSTPYFRSRSRRPIRCRAEELLVVDDVGEHRLPSVTSLDARVGRVSRSIASGERDVDVFNVLNSNTVLDVSMTCACRLRTTCWRS